jgi:hypothetical protein
MNEGLLLVDHVIELLPPATDGVFRPVHDAVRHSDVSFAIILPNLGPFSLPLDKPTITSLIDIPSANGPAAFDEESVSRLLANISAAILISDRTQGNGYSFAADVASMLRRHVAIVETGLKFEPVWTGLIERVRPGLPTLVYSPRPQGGIH